MLKIAKKKDSEKILEFCLNSVIGARIAGYIESYGFEREFLTLWTEETDGIIHSVIASFDSNITLKADENADIDEIGNFINMLSCKSITCPNETAKALGYTDYTVKTALEYCGEDISDSDNISSCCDLREAYQLISESIPNSFSDSKEAYLSWLSDFTFRQRRNKARMKSIVENGELSACALTSAESKNQAIISGVACRSNIRKTGYGRKVVTTLANELKKENKSVYVIALNDSAVGFYKKIGFVESEKIALVKGNSNV